MAVRKHPWVSRDGWTIKAPLVRLPYSLREDEATTRELHPLVGTFDSDPAEDMRRVWPFSPKPLRRAVETVARQFRREFDYDFVQYSANERTSERDAVWAFVEECGHSGYAIVVGAVCFRHREWTDHPSGLVLTWVWLHPFVRRRGWLSEAWPVFRGLYGDFLVEPPLSVAMRSFLARRKECHICGRDCTCESHSLARYEGEWAGPIPEPSPPQADQGVIPNAPTRGVQHEEPT